MQQVYTEDDIIRYVYNEVSASEKVLIEKAMENQPSLFQAYNQLLEIKSRMDGVVLNPNASSVELILEHSIKTSSHLEASI